MVMKSKGLGEMLSTSYRYAFVSPDVTMFPNDNDFAMLEGVIVGNKLTLTNTSTNEVLTTLTKE